jgi:hypothetical protein
MELHKLTVRIPVALVEPLKIRAIRERMSMQDLVVKAIREYIRTPLVRKPQEEPEYEAPGEDA